MYENEAQSSSLHVAVPFDHVVLFWRQSCGKLRDVDCKPRKPPDGVFCIIRRLDLFAVSL